jgi:hypothetical protein
MEAACECWRYPQAKERLEGMLFTLQRAVGARSLKSTLKREQHTNFLIVYNRTISIRCYFYVQPWRRDKEKKQHEYSSSDGKWRAAFAS